MPPTTRLMHLSVADVLAATMRLSRTVKQSTSFARSPDSSTSTDGDDPSAVAEVLERADNQCVARDLQEERHPQNPCDSIAPGISSMMALSTISMIAIEMVSEASAIGMTAVSARPERSSGRLVSP